MNVSYDSYFYSGCCYTHPDGGPASPWAFSCDLSCSGGFQGLNFADQSMMKLTRQKQGPFLTGTGVSQAVTSLCPLQALRSTSRKRKEEWAGQAGCRHIIKDFLALTAWRINLEEARTVSSIPENLGSQDEIPVSFAPDLQQFIPTCASVLYTTSMPGVGSSGSTDGSQHEPCWRLSK